MQILSAKTEMHSFSHYGIKDWRRSLNGQEIMKDCMITCGKLLIILPSAENFCCIFQMAD